jgi:hypothetical protein
MDVLLNSILEYVAEHGIAVTFAAGVAYYFYQDNAKLRKGIDDENAKLRKEIDDLRKDFAKLNAEYHDKLLELVKNYNSGLGTNNFVLGRVESLLDDVKNALEKE